MSINLYDMILSKEQKKGAINESNQRENSNENNQNNTQNKSSNTEPNSKPNSSPNTANNEVQNKAQEQNNNSFPNFEYDRYFLGWMREVKCSFLVSSYKTAKIYALGVIKDPRDNQDKISIWLSHFNRPMGIHSTHNTIWISSSGNLWKYENSGSYEDANNIGVFDGNFIPRLAYFSNDIDTHDICVDKDGNPYYCSAMFSCVCTPSLTHSFKVFWKPPWISKISPEDRCH